MILYNGTLIEFGKFPNGEINLRKDSLGTDRLYPTVTLKYEDDSDLLHLLWVRALLDIPATLRITYTPYSRMDRDSDTYVFSLKVFADFINSMNWAQVVIYEPHSDVLPALLDRVQVINITASPQMRSKIYIAFGGENFQVCYPDVGAFKRYQEKFKSKDPLIGFKVRDFETGKILGLEIEGDKHVDNVVIVDDLCSKGGTFVLAAKQLRAKGFTKIVLAVTHCENTIYTGEVFNHIDKVITTDSIINPTTIGAIDYKYKNKLQVIPLTEW
jgi:ribose-phosphate pyrophosphokinase